MAKLVMVVDVLVTQRDPLADHRPQTMNRQFRHPVIVETSRNPIKQPNHPIRMAKQQRPGIRGDRTAVKCRHNATAIKPFKTVLIGDTLRSHRTLFQNLLSLCYKRTLQYSWGRCTL